MKSCIPLTKQWRDFIDFMSISQHGRVSFALISLFMLHMSKILYALNTFYGCTYGEDLGIFYSAVQLQCSIGCHFIYIDLFPSCQHVSNTRIWVQHRIELYCSK